MQVDAKDAVICLMESDLTMTVLCCSDPFMQVDAKDAVSMLDEAGIDQGDGDDAGIDFPSWQHVGLLCAFCLSSMLVAAEIHVGTMMMASPFRPDNT